jgi:hypothetical protein
LFASNIKKEVCGVFDSFLSILKKYEERKAHDMLLLMLDPQLKILHLVPSFVSREQDIFVIKKYDWKSL